MGIKKDWQSRITLDLRRVTNKDQWNQIAARTPQSIFLQSWEWGEFQQAVGRTVERFGLYRGGKLVGIASCVRFSLPFGKYYWLIPRGPIISEEPKTTAYVETFNTFLSLLQKELTGVFLKIEPHIELCFESMFLLVAHGSKLQRVAHVHPEDSRVLLLHHTEEELLSGMHQKTRYNIRLAEKKGVTVEVGKKYISDFLALNRETTDRDGFTAHPDAYYKKMVAALPSDILSVYAAKYNNKIIAANLVIHFGDTTTYVHGASSSEERTVMAPHLLQWRQIQDAQKYPSRYYDFWGIAPSIRPSPMGKKWDGITRFKNGFGGVEKNYVGTFDLPIRSGWYRLYRVAKQLRNL